MNPEMDNLKLYPYKNPVECGCIRRNLWKKGMHMIDIYHDLTILGYHAGFTLSGLIVQANV